MINLSQLSREQLMIYFANANDQLLIAEKLTKQYEQLKSQIKSTVASNDNLKKKILDSIRIAQDFTNETGYSHATSWDSLKRNVGTTATVAGGVFLFKSSKGIYNGFKNWLKDGCLTYIIAAILITFLGSLLKSLLGIVIPLQLQLLVFVFALVVYPIIKSRQRKKTKLKEINQEILANNAYCTSEANKLDAQIKEAVNVWNNKFPEFPKEYAYSYATSYFYKTLESYRANNIQEVINAFEEYLYRERMIDLQNQNIQEQRKSNIIAQENLYVNLANLNSLRAQTQAIYDEIR